MEKKGWKILAIVFIALFAVLMFLSVGLVSMTGKVTDSMSGGNNSCMTDFNDDGAVDVVDLLTLAGEFGRTDCGSAQVQCTDSDGGNNVNIKGTTSGLNIESNQSLTRTDFCYDSSQIAEFYCNDIYPGLAPGYVNNAVSNCPNGCSGGVCLAGNNNTYCGDGACNGDETCSSCSSDCGSCGVNITTCTDSDGGANPYVKGTTTGIQWPNTYGDLVVSFTDSCMDSTKVLESACIRTSNSSTDNKYVYSGYMNCPAGGINGTFYNGTCVNGACI